MPVTVVQPGFVNGGAKARERSDRARGGVWEGGFHCREIFENSFMKTAFSCTLNSIIIRGGRLYEMEKYQSPTPPFLKFFYANQLGGGGMGACTLSYANDSGAARICQRVGGRGEWGEGIPFLFLFCV